MCKYPPYFRDVVIYCDIIHILYNSTNKQIPPLAAVSAFTSLPPPDCATASKCRRRITEVGGSWAWAICVALLGGLTYAKKRLAIHVHQLKEWSICGGVDAIERAVWIAAIQLAVLADSSALVVRFSHIQSLVSIRDEVRFYSIVA